MKKSILCVIIFLCFFACSKDDNIDLSGFEPIASNVPYSDLNASENLNYFELVRGPEELINVSFQEGTLCPDDPDYEGCLSAFLSILPENGFRSGCHPASCFYFIRYQENSENHLVDTDEKLLDFLGDIDTKSEALLWVFAHEYYFEANNVNAGGIKQVSDGFELIMLKTVSYCTPVQSNRFHLNINKNGEITIVKEEVYSVEENACV